MIKLNNLHSSAFSTTAFRAAAVVVAVFLLVAAAIMWFVSRETNRVMTEQVLAALSSEARLLKVEAQSGGIEGLRRAIILRSNAVGAGLYYLGEASGKHLAGNLREVPVELRGKGAGGVFKYRPRSVSDGAKHGTNNRNERLAVGIALTFPGVNVVIARDVEDQRALSYHIRLVSLLGFGLLGVGGLIAGFTMSRLVLARVKTITNASRAIMAGDLSERLPRTGSGDEFDRLAQNLNEMLARIEQLMHGLREVSDNIAHDLKTPLNRLRNRAEEALRDPRGAQAQKEGLERTIEAADELITTFNALLLIARLEAGAVEETLEDADVRAIVADVAELYEPVATDAGLNLILEGESGRATTIAVNRQLVGQSVANLIDNAIKYTKTSFERTRRREPVTSEIGTSAPPRQAAELRDPPGKTDIRVTVRSTRDGVEIAVGDRGPGIPPQDRDRVLKRFVRLEKSRTAPGTGLGLSLVAAVARLHGGRVRLEDNHPGLKVVVFLPRQR